MNRFAAHVLIAFGWLLWAASGQSQDKAASQSVLEYLGAGSTT